MASGDGPSAGPPPRKQQKLNEQGDGGFSQETQTLKEIIEWQNEINSMNEKAAVEVLDVERRYNKLRKPYLLHRGDLIQKVPNFWFSTLLNHPHISSILTEGDQKCLRYLMNVEVEDSEDVESGYWIKFYFNENPFFENKVLTKEFRLRSTDAISSSSEIIWKTGMDLTDQSSESHTTDKTSFKTPKSFFDWFQDNSDPLEDRIANAFKDDVWANPLQYFIGLEEGEDENTDMSSNEDKEEEDDDEEP